MPKCPIFQVVAMRPQGARRAQLRVDADGMIGRYGGDRQVVARIACGCVRHHRVRYHIIEIPVVCPKNSVWPYRWQGRRTVERHRVARNPMAVYVAPETADRLREIDIANVEEETCLLQCCSKRQ